MTDAPPAPVPLSGHGVAGAVAATPSQRLAALLEAAPDRRAAVLGSGRPLAVATADLVTYPLATRHHLGNLWLLAPPLVWVTLRMLVIQWDDDQGRCRTLLWNPVDHQLSRPRPGVRLPGMGLVPGASTVHGTVVGHLRALGLDPSDVDYVAFDHLQRRDLRRLLGTDRPAADIGAPDGPLPGWLPRARLVVHRTELDAARRPHPARRGHYLPRAFESLRQERVEVVDGDVLLGPGVALLAMPGLTSGQASLAIHTDQGLWVASANGIVVDCWQPASSRVHGLARLTAEDDHQVVLPAAAAELATWQHDAMLVERALADRHPRAPFPQCLPSTELADHPLNGRLRAAHRYGVLSHGRLRGGTVLPDRELAV